MGIEKNTPLWGVSYHPELTSGVSGNQPKVVRRRSGAFGCSGLWCCYAISGFSTNGSPQGGSPTSELMVVELSGKGRVPVPARRVSSVDIQFPGGEKSYMVVSTTGQLPHSPSPEGTTLFPSRPKVSLIIFHLMTFFGGEHRLLL